MSTKGEQAASVDLVRLLESRGYRPVWRSKDGDKAVFHVPWRIDRHPSLAVYRRGSVWFWTDHARQENGTTVQALQRLEHLDRKDAIRALLGQQSPEGQKSLRPNSAAKEKEREHRIAEARQAYERAWKAMTSQRSSYLSCYWQERGFRTVPDIGAVWLELPAGDRNRPYMGIPLPSPEKIRAVECRLLDGRSQADRVYRARTIGPKELWVRWQSDRSRIVIAESILDALSYSQLWPDRSESLVALNGVGNARLLPSLVEWARKAGRPIQDVILALDNDQAGRQAAEKAAACLGSSVRIYRLDDLTAAGVKDLHKLLLQSKNAQSKKMSPLRRLA